MKFVTDTQKTDDPREFGELLREYAFSDTPCPTMTGFHKPYGCYSTFDLKPEFVKLSLNTEVYKNLEWLSDVLRTDGRVEFYAYSNGQVHVGWWWDGDGTLIIQEGDRIAINTDCKCDDWEWCENVTN